MCQQRNKGTVSVTWDGTLGFALRSLVLGLPALLAALLPLICCCVLLRERRCVGLLDKEPGLQASRCFVATLARFGALSFDAPSDTKQNNVNRGHFILMGLDALRP